MILSSLEQTGRSYHKSASTLDRDRDLRRDRRRLGAAVRHVPRPGRPGHRRQRRLQRPRVQERAGGESQADRDQGPAGVEPQDQGQLRQRRGGRDRQGAQHLHRDQRPVQRPGAPLVGLVRRGHLGGHRSPQVRATRRRAGAGHAPAPARSRVVTRHLPASVAAPFLLRLLPACAAVGPPSPSVRSVVELRSERVVLQHFDLTCGAAALATLLAFQQDDPVGEREVALGLMGRPEYLETPELVTVRQGFSLLDLQRYVEGHGYRERPLGGLEYADLPGLAPLIVVIEEAGYNHFVVYRGRMLDRVLLADPAFGTRTMRVDQFKHAWISHGKLGRVGFVLERTDGRSPPDRLAPRPEEFLTFG